MTLRFTMLASGSGGNACLIRSAASGLLIDAGLPPAELETRLRLAGHAPEAVNGMLLTHTHGDHWNDAMLSWFAARSIPIFVHASHLPALGKSSTGFRRLNDAGLVMLFDPGMPFAPVVGFCVSALRVRHDGSGGTFGFRVEGPTDLFGNAAAVGYAADLGCWDAELVRGLIDVNLLAVEFNHDVLLQQQSKRPQFLINRVLGNEGHLSNEQGAALVEAVHRASTPGRLEHVVLLHLSGECNRPALARKVAKECVAQFGHKVRVHVAEQDAPGVVVRLKPGELA